MLNIEEFKARNAEAQQINIKIQQAQGAIDENKRQFEQLCAEYKAAYGQAITADNLAEILNACEAEIQKLGEAQAQAIENAKAGVVKSNEGTQNVGAAAQNGVAAAQTIGGAAQNVDVTAQNVGAAAQTAGTPAQYAAQTVQSLTQAAAEAAKRAQMTGAVAQNAVQAGTVAPQAPTQGTIPQAPVGLGAVSSAQMTGAAAQVGIQPTTPPVFSPVSINTLGQGAMQNANLPDTKMPATQIAPTPAIQPTQAVAGWSQRGTPDFNAILGGKFGG